MNKKKEDFKLEAPEIKSVSELKFSVERLGENCQRLFGVSRSTFDGAASGLKNQYTVQEMKDIISKWLKKEAK